MGHRHVLLVFSMALLLVATTHAAGGHAQAAAAAATAQQGMDGVAGSLTRRSMIGSAPPSCEGKCGWSCVGRSCKAVLVPIEPPQEQDDSDTKQSRRDGSGGGDGSTASSAAAQRQPSWYDGGGRGPDYKAVAWRCECVGAS